MRFDTSQHMRLGQHMKLAPRMIQSMEILQMPLLKLEERIEQELESNVALELVEPGAEEGGLREEREEARREDTEGERPISVDEKGGSEEFERLASYESANPEAVENEYDGAVARPSRADEVHGSYSRARMNGERDGKIDAMANTAARPRSLTEQLQEQWRFADVDAALRPLGELIINYIEEDGYLRTDLGTIIENAPASLPRPTMEQMQRALSAVQLVLDPPGIGARDVRESLLLQLDALEEERPGEGWDVVRSLVAEHMDDLVQNRMPRIAEKTGLGLDEVKAAVEKMRLLSLAPGRQLVSESPSAIIPDAVVEYDAENDRYVAYLNDTRMSSLRINRHYALMAKDRGVARPTREFLKKNLSNASWLIDAVEQRRRTLLRVINVVVEAQRDFFDYGEQALKPLPMTQVAEQLGVHVATVSRAVAEKHLLTPRGIVPLRSFFTGGTQTVSGEEVSWDAVKAALREVIDAEDKREPYSDEALAEKLKERGIEIARRTVAKYRTQLEIPSARLRRQY